MATEQGVAECAECGQAFLLPERHLCPRCTATIVFDGIERQCRKVAHLQGNHEILYPTRDEQGRSVHVTARWAVKA